MKRIVTADIEKINICEISSTYYVELDTTKSCKTRKKKKTNVKSIELCERYLKS